MNKKRLWIIPIILVLLIASGACSPAEESTPAAPATEAETEATPPSTPPPSTNQAPAISSLSTAQTQVYPSTKIEVQCNASDPDGDAITYDWATTGGKFSGTGDILSWIAPEQYGDWDITVTVKDGNGGITQSTITVSVVSNMDPEISSLVASPTIVPPEGKATVTCTASDPDGDVLNYGWKANYGEITGVGSSVTWIAPDTEGEYDITVTVGDGNGGVNVSTVSITVERTMMEPKTFTPVASETGTMSSSGDKDLTRTIAGDNVDNEGYRAFWSFDLYSIRGTDVKEAHLTFTTKKVEREPFVVPTGLRGLHIWQIRTEAGDLPEYYTEPVKELSENVLWEPPEVIDVTTIVKNIGRGLGADDRVQVMAGFQRKTNANALAEYVQWLSVTLTVSYAEK